MRLLPVLLLLLGVRVAELPIIKRNPVPVASLDSPLLDSLLRGQPTFDTLLTRADELNLQIIYTQINRDAQNQPHFTRHAWHVDPARYFNPASLVKLPVCVAALEKLHRYEAAGVTPGTPMATGVAYRCQTPVRHSRSRDPDRVASIGNYIRRMLLVSDNDAYNRVYEFVGQQQLHERLAAWQMPTARITNRFTPGCDSLANRHTNPVIFFPAGRPAVSQPPAFNEAPLPPPLGRVRVGTGYRAAGNRLIPEPYDFTNANHLTLDQETNLLQSILFPGTNGVTLDLSFSDRRLLVQYLGLAPHESRYSLYQSKDYYDCYKKYALYGRDPKASYPAGDLRSFNIVGLSYGYVADCAYFAEPSTGTEFMLSAVLYVNHDGILNDGKYEYGSVGWPFLGALGRAIYAYEKKRARPNPPDLSDFRF